MSLSISPLPSIATNSHTQFGTTVTPPSSPCFQTPSSPGFKTSKRNLTLPSVSPTSPLATLSAPPPSPKPRRKALGPGCGLLDWIRLCRSSKDLTAVGGKLLTVTEEELAKHNTPDDAWTAIRGALVAHGVAIVEFAHLIVSVNSSCRQGIQHHTLHEVSSWRERGPYAGCRKRLYNSF